MWYRIITSSLSACCILLGLFTSQTYAKISNNEIMSIAEDIKVASEDRDIRDLMFHLAPDIQIIMGDDMDNEKVNQEFDYMKYRNYIGRIFPLVTRYDYIRNNEKIWVSELNDNRALYTFELTEDYVINEKNIIEKHTEEWHIRKVNGELEVYKVVIN